MQTLYLDIFSGISGDMFLGAMLDIGLDETSLRAQLECIPVDGYQLRVARGTRSSVEGVKFDVLLENASSVPMNRGRHTHEHHDHTHEHHDHTHEHHDHTHVDGHARTFTAIRELIESTTLSEWVKRRSISVFHRIADAEGKIHGVAPEKVHFHEVGAVDSIVDILGACLALEMMGKPRVLASPVVEGSGSVHCAHGTFPVPTMATLSILGSAGIELTQCDIPHELVTPTGAALLAEFVESFGPMRALVADKVGYGLGGRDIPGRPNVLRAILGEMKKADDVMDWETDSIVVLETNIDDCRPEILGHFVDLALESGALDVFHIPIYMKKNRPGVLLSLLCRAEDADRFRVMILSETSAFGVRSISMDRHKLQRSSSLVQTPYGPVEAKFGSLNGRVLHRTPEFESCKKVAQSAGVSVKVVYQAVDRIFEEDFPAARKT
ncbi:nickel pincer cofactor biosynthesis protein LarC [Verrucomicrobia bacterium]|nr:nickel pincer cofactor biosynthesis protein LarC [Verrucomicrobiota bacterium]